MAESGAPAPIFKIGSAYDVFEALEIDGPWTRHPARDRLSGRMCRLDVLQAEGTGRSVQVSRALSELRGAMALSHERIRTILDVGRYKDTCYYALEGLDGPPLHRGPRGADLPMDQALLIGRALAEAMAAAHAAGIVHGDLSPACVRRGRAGSIRVEGFGLAAIGRSLGGPHATRHLPFKAPEQIRDIQEPTPAADLYGIGAVLYYLFTGQAPFVGEETASILPLLETGPTPLAEARPDLPPALCALVMRALAFTPDERYENAADLRNALIHLQTGLAATIHGMAKAETTGGGTADRAGATAEAVVRVFSPNDGCLALPLEGREWMIGRGQNADIHLRHQGVSRSHARLIPFNAGYEVEDLDSSSGTTLNGEPLRGSKPLSHGDTIQICHYVLQYREERDPSESSASSSNAMGFSRLPTSLHLRFRYLHLAPERVFAPGDTIAVGEGGILLAMPETPPVGVILEVELGWPDKKKRRFMGEMLGPADEEGSEVCVKLHRVEKDVYDRIMRSCRRGEWLTSAEDS